MSKALHLSAGPHIRDRWTTPFIMMVVLIALTPAAVIGVVVNYVKFHSLNALWVILAAIGSAILTELLFCLVTRRKISIWDGSAAVTGMLLALCLSPNTHIVLPIIGSAFAILVVKCLFGGLGKNFINPALAARCFLLLSFGNYMSNNYPSFDAITSATPVEMLYKGEMVNVTRMFLGTGGGIIGSSILALLIGGLVLWGLDIIHGEICFSVLGAFTLVLALFGGHGFDPGYLAAQLCGGGVVMGAFFMATDYTTSPVSRLGQLVYGCLIGVLGALFRIYGKGTDMFSYSIIIANLFTPLIDLYIVPKPFAYRKRSVEKAEGVQKPPFYKRIPKSVIALALIAAVAGVALSGVFSITKTPIEENEKAKKQAAYIAVCENAVPPFREIAADALKNAQYGTTTIEEAWEGVDENGNTVGYVLVLTNTDAYNPPLKLALGIAPDGKILKIDFIELNETPGKGSKAADPAFKDQFKDLTSTEDVDTITGATVTSKAVINAIDAGLDFFRKVIMEGGN